MATKAMISVTILSGDQPDHHLVGVKEPTVILELETEVDPQEVDVENVHLFKSFGGGKAGQLTGWQIVRPDQPSRILVFRQSNGAALPDARWLGVRFTAGGDTHVGGAIIDQLEPRSVLSPQIAMAMAPDQHASLLGAGAAIEKDLREGLEISARVDETLEAGLLGANRIMGSVAANLLGYPIQTGFVEGAPPDGPSDGPALTAAVDREVRQLLGKVPDSSNASAVTAALQVFSPRDEDGVTVFDWTPPSYVAKTQLGAGVTGAQASLASITSTIADSIRPLADGLQPLVEAPRADPEEVAANKAIFREALDDFVNEVSLEGGPRTARARMLLAQMNEEGNELGWRLSMVRANNRAQARNGGPIERTAVVLAADEENLTNYMRVRDGISILTTQFAIYDQPAVRDADLGRLYVFLERALGRLAELASDLEHALDWVYIGQSERDSIVLPGTDMTIDQLTSWIKEFGQTEAPQLIASGGRRGVAAIAITLGDPRAVGGVPPGTLNAAIGGFSTLIANPPQPNDLPDGLWHPRVAVALDALSRATADAYTQAQNAA
jgi:hypothetical protein